MILRILALLLAVCAHAQLTTGIVEGVLRSADGSLLPNSPLPLTGGAGLRITLRTDSRGVFTVALPYGTYKVGDQTVVIVPWKTTYVHLQPAPSSGLWVDSTRAHTYPEPFSLPGILLGREPSTVTQPLDFTGTADNRLWVQSQRAISWTSAQFKLQGIDATDPYQPGRPLLLPDVESVDELVVRGGFSQTSSTGYGTEAGVFLREPGLSWQSVLSSVDTGGVLASSNQPPLDRRGLVQQSDRFHWFTRDRLEITGPLGRWADIYASATGQWASQTVTLAAPGSDQRSRLLFATTRGRIHASARDQIEGDYIGSRIDLSDWAVPIGIELLAANRVGPPFVLPGGFPGEFEVDHMDFVQAGWTHESPQSAGLDAVQVRYGYSTAHLDSGQTGHGAGPTQSRIELLDGAITGAAPLQNFAVRTRHSIQAAWHLAARRTGPIHHQIVAGGGWTTTAPRNRFLAPSNLDLITANSAPAFVARFNTPLDTRETVRTFTAYAADRLMLSPAVVVDAGILADFSRGSAAGASGTLIGWNSISPRVGFTWRVPGSHGLVLRIAYFRVYAPLAGRYLDFGTPDSLSGSKYAWLDRNGDGVFQPGEEGPLLIRFGGLYSSISSSLQRPYSDEFDIGAGLFLPHQISATIRFYRRDDKHRIAAEDVGIPAQAFTPVRILDPGPDGIAGTYDDRQLLAYQQNPATFGQDRYVLTNPAGLREQYTGLVAELHREAKTWIAGASLAVEKSWGPTNPGNSAMSNDPGVLGSLFLDPNSQINATGHDFFDRAFVGKVYASYHLPWAGVQLATVADYLDGLVFARQLLVTGLPQGPFLIATTLRGSPEGGNRAEHITNWNLRVAREFTLPLGRIAVTADLLNVTNAGHAIEQNDVTGPSFNLRLPVALQAARTARFGFRYEF